MAEGQNGGPGPRDQKHRHRRRAEPASCEDSLFGAGGGRDQGGDCRLQEKASRRVGADYVSARGQAIHSESSARQVDFFSFLGLPRKLTIDLADLDERYRALSRQFHPDYFYNAPAAERRASLERSSYLNDAYRTLRHPAARIEYLLKIEGFGGKGPDQATRHVPPALLEEVFALNEELDEIRAMRESGAAPEQWTARLERARQP